MLVNKRIFGKNVNQPQPKQFEFIHTLIIRTQNNEKHHMKLKFWWMNSRIDICRLEVWNQRSPTPSWPQSVPAASEAAAAAARPRPRGPLELQSRKCPPRS